MKLYFKQKIFKLLDHFEVFDEDQNVLYTVDQRLKLLQYSADVTSIVDKTNFTIESKIISLLPKYVISYENGESIFIDFKLSLLHRKIILKTTFGELSVRGNFWDMDFDVLYEDKVVATISKEWFAFADTYEMNIYDDRFTSAVLGITIAIDNVKDIEASAE